MQQSQQVAPAQQQQAKPTAWEQIVQYRDQLAQDLQRVEQRVRGCSSSDLHADVRIRVRDHAATPALG
jgi:hypothetical protein